MNKKIYFEILTINQVVVKTITTTVVEGIEYQLGQINTENYVNSNRDRERLKKNLDEKNYNIVLAMWGDTPTVEEKTLNDTQYELA